MATKILSLHWKAARVLLIPFVIAAFALPLVSVQGFGAGFSDLQSHLILTNLFPLLAAALGAVLALTAWNWDHQNDHVYSLALPVARWEYTLLKFGGGVVLSFVPGLAFLAGCLVAAVSVSLSPGLETYPFLLTGRFLFATLLLYAVMFALAAGTIRTTIVLLSVLVGAPIVFELAFEFMSQFYPLLGEVNLLSELILRVSEYPGPFHVFFGNWALIDV